MRRDQAEESRTDTQAKQGSTNEADDATKLNSGSKTALPGDSDKPAEEPERLATTQDDSATDGGAMDETQGDLVKGDEDDVMY